MGKRENGQGNIVERKDGRWVGKIRIGKTEDGKPKIKSFYGKDDKEVKRKLKEFIKEMHKNDFETIQKTTVRQYMNTWLTETKANELKSSSYGRKEQVLENQVYPYIGDLQVSNLTTSDIQSMINSLSKKYSYSTIKKAYEAVNACMKLAIIKRDIQYNPALGVTLPTNIQKSEGEIIFFSEPEIKLITEEAARKYNNDIPIYRLGHAVLFLLNTGLRIGEALALQWRDIDFANKTVFIKKNVKLVKNRDSKQETKYILKEQNNPKTKKVQGLYH